MVVNFWTLNHYPVSERYKFVPVEMVLKEDFDLPSQDVQLVVYG
jgi:hypothetical protein